MKEAMIRGLPLAFKLAESKEKKFYKEDTPPRLQSNLLDGEQVEPTSENP
jgi:hypothetical protein